MRTDESVGRDSRILKLRPLQLTIVFAHVILCSWSAFKHSPTIDEPAYLASGISHWEYGRFDLCRVSPPLVRLVAAIPVRFANPKLEWRNYVIGPGIRAEHPVGHDFVVANGNRTFWLFTLGRWACIPFSLLGAWISYRWAGHLFGSAAANVALMLWCFSPFILAHAQLLTPDIGVSSLCLAACYSFWKWSKSPTFVSASIAAAVLGLAILAKTNALVLVPALAVAIVFDALIARRLPVLRTAAQAIVATAIALYVVNLGYVFEGTLKPLGEYNFFSSTFGNAEGGNRFKDSVLSHVPIPLPAAFLEGIDLQRRDFENDRGVKETYFRGQWYHHGWWWYYFYVVAVKVPVGSWILCLVGCIQIARYSRRRREILCYLVLPGAALFGLACSQTGFSHSLRYVLPALPFALIIASAAVSSPMARWKHHVTAAAFAGSLVSGLSSYPHTISYFNELAGGPRNGHFHLLDSNCDSGQDLIYIRDWIASHPDLSPVYVAYWGMFDPNDAGLDLKTDHIQAGKPIPPGWYLISVNHLHGEYRRRRPELEQFLGLDPASYVTPSTYVYYIPQRNSE